MKYTLLLLLLSCSQVMAQQDTTFATGQWRYKHRKDTSFPNHQYPTLVRTVKDSITRGVIYNFSDSSYYVMDSLNRLIEWNLSDSYKGNKLVRIWVEYDNSSGKSEAYRIHLYFDDVTHPTKTVSFDVGKLIKGRGYKRVL